METYLIAWISRKGSPPAVSAASIAATTQPVPIPAWEHLAPVVLLSGEGATLLDAEADVLARLSSPRWRWVWNVPQLGAGFRHRWTDGACSRCGIGEHEELRASGHRGPDVCLVSHVAACAMCGAQGWIVSGDATCPRCWLTQRTEET